MLGVSAKGSDGTAKMRWRGKKAKGYRWRSEAFVANLHFAKGVSRYVLIDGKKLFHGGYASQWNTHGLAAVKQILGTVPGERLQYLWL